MTPKEVTSEPVVTVHLPPAAVKIVEELTEEETALRHQLEMVVEKSFYQAGCALRELRDLRLYRSTHKTFEKYCKDRFGYSRRHPYRLIDAAGVMDNLCPNRTHNDSSEEPKKILPTKIEQVRPLTALKPEEQREVWQQAVEQAGGKLPSGRAVYCIVEKLKERGATRPKIPFQQGDVVLVRGMGNPDLRKFDGQWAIALSINEYSVTVALGGKDMSVKPEFLEPIEPKYWAEIKAVNERVGRLQLLELDPIEEAALRVLRRLTCFTPKQMILLKFLEQQYGIE